ncbi:MAG: hypothetical protein U1E83_01275 [Methylotetracoccus sp.]
MAVYIDGYMSFDWCNEPTEIVRKVWRRREHFVWSPKLRSLAKKREKSRDPEARKFANDVLRSKATTYDPWFPSGTAFVRQITRTCESVEWIRNDGQEAA